MKKQIAISAALLALGVGGVETAQAQLVPLGPRVYAPGLPPYQVVRIVQSAGLTPITQPVRRGPSYVLVATDRAGVQMRVVVDAYGGEIVRVRPVLVAMRPYGRPVVRAYPPRVVAPYEPPVAVAPRREIKDPPRIAYGPGPVTPRAGIDGDALPPVPQRDVPNARVATVPSTAGTHTLAAAPTAPARTPLPRPRPKVAANEPADAAATSPPPPVAAPAEAKPAPTTGAKVATPPKANELQMVPVAPLE